jgi:hypothetical protein
MFTLIKYILYLIIISLALGALRTWQMNHGEKENTFLTGTVPNLKPDGLYAGTVPGRTVSWQGKKFNRTNSTGINVFNNGERYSFITSAGKGITDKKLDVFKIEYNVPTNPWWLRPILDEVVEITPGYYLGKLQLRIIPGHPFTLMYFELRK